MLPAFMTGSISAPEATVIVGAFVLAGTTINAYVADRAAKKRIGTPNGKGNVVEMLERVLITQADQANTLTRLYEMKTNEHNDIRHEITAVSTEQRSAHADLREAIHRLEEKLT